MLCTALRCSAVRCAVLQGYRHMYHIAYSYSRWYMFSSRSCILCYAVGSWLAYRMDVNCSQYGVLQPERVLAVTRMRIKSRIVERRQEILRFWVFATGYIA